jgi:hypothetical protein
MEDNIFTVKILDVIIPEIEGREQPPGIFLVMSHVN